MIHQFRDKKQIAKRRNIQKILIICGLFLLLSFIGVLTFWGRIFISLGRPIWQVENNLNNSIHNVSYLVRTKSSVFNENENLKKENIDLKLSMIDYQVLKKENEDIKALFGRIQPKDTFVLASILTKPNRSPYDTIIIDVGFLDGINEGSIVYANVDVPIGQISKVYNNTSLVMLYSNPGQITEAVLNGSNTSVELIGRGGGNFEMTVPIDLVFDNGEMVILPGINPKIIAIIDGVISIPNDPVKKIILHSPVNIQNLKWVQIKKD